MVKQTIVDRRKMVRKLWKDLGKRFLLMLGAGCLIVVIMPITRFMPFAYLCVFFITFGISWVWMFRKKEIRDEFLGDQ
jgi:hypothetical protein